MSDEDPILFNVHFECDEFRLVVYLEDDYTTDDQVLIDRAFDLMRDQHGFELVGKVHTINVEAI